MWVALPTDGHAPRDGGRPFVELPGKDLAGHKGRDAQVVGGVGGQIREEHHVFLRVVHHFHRPLGVSRTLGGIERFTFDCL